jgi:hypothetical protein
MHGLVSVDILSFGTVSRKKKIKFIHSLISNSSRCCVADRPRLGEGSCQMLAVLAGVWPGWTAHFTGMGDKENTGFSDSNRFFNYCLIGSLTFVSSTGTLE